MHPIWAQGRARVGGLAFGLSDHALGCSEAPALGVSAHRVGARAGHQPQVTDLGSPRSPTTLGPSCSGMGCWASGILCRCTHPGLGASGSLGEAGPRESPGSPPGRWHSHGCYIWEKFTEGSGGMHTPPTWGWGDLGRAGTTPALS